MARFPTILLAFFSVSILHAAAVQPIRLDADGILRWVGNDREVVLFGVNYYVPFSVDYDLIQRRGLDHEQAIRDDVAHFQRLGLTSIRLHCWDREISDREGNLVDNEHLRLLDLLIHECKERGIYTVLTPIAWWGAPKPGGFSDLFPMFEMTTKPDAWRLQQRYLAQFVQHRNHYTGLRYMDDPAIVAFEVINEPLYPKGIEDTLVTDYINALVSAVKNTGCVKPVFYNCWQNRHAAAAASSILDGVTFGWYPTGLVSGATITTDALPKVDDFPKMRDPLLAGKAKMVYEFDAADVHEPYMYPAIARAFRSGGAQVANQFQYDPACVADTNRNWQTHYLNLLYTPGKAVSFAIAGEAFRQLPRLKQYGTYPASARFGEFRVSFEEQLSEWLGKTAFMYSNDTDSKPPNPAALTRIWACGSSPLVSYSGTGAYFLDRVSEGIWSLQIYPDAVQVADPYSGGDSIKTCLVKSSNLLRLSLPDLGMEPQIFPGGEGAVAESAGDGAFRVCPGQYWVTRKGTSLPESPRAPIPFVCPDVQEPDPTLGSVTVVSRWREGYALKVSAGLPRADIRAVNLRFRVPPVQDFASVPMTKENAYRYTGIISAKMCRPGMLELYVEADTAKGVLAFPGGIDGIPQGSRRHTFLTVTPDLTPAEINASSDVPGGAHVEVLSDSATGAHYLRLSVERFGKEPSCVGMVLKSGSVSDLDFEPTAISARLRGGPDTSAVELGFKLEDGTAFGANFAVGQFWDDATIPLVQTRPLWGTSPKSRDLAILKEVSVIFGTWLFGSVADRRHWVDLQSLSLVRAPEILTTRIVSRADPVTLVCFAETKARVRGGSSTVRRVSGMSANSRALHVVAGPFGPPPDCRSFRTNISPEILSWLVDQQTSALLVRARAVKLETHAIELVLLEADGSPWGLNLPLTQEWQSIRVPIRNLRCFSNWPHPAQRGGADDRFDITNLTAVNICFGSWLYGDHAGSEHGFEIQDISAEIGLD